MKKYEQGQRLGGERYEIDHCLSKAVNEYVGGYVYGAFTLSPVRRLVTLKQIKEEAIAKSEARHLADLKHPAIPFLIDYFEEQVEGKRYYHIVMEYVVGETFSAYLAQNVPAYTVEQALTWHVELLRVLEYLHDRTIIHRDIKPDNIRLWRDIKTYTEGLVALLDFGISANRSDGQVTFAQAKVGYTEPYASPEQVGFEGTDARSDVYAVGATLYHMLTRKEPEFASVRRIRHKDDRPDPPSPVTYFQSLPEHLDAEQIASVITRAMSYAPEARFQTAREMRQALQLAMGGAQSEAGAAVLIAGRYRVIEPLAALAGVSEAFDEQEKQKVILARARDITPEDEPLLEQALYRREQLGHDALPRVLRRSQDSEQRPGLYVAFEHRDGAPISHQPLTITVTESTTEHTASPQLVAQAVQPFIDWLVKCLDALAYLHGQSPPIPVGNLEPATIIVHGEAVHFQLFILDQPHAHTSITISRRYQSPERRQSNQPSPEDDLFALATCFYLVLTGEHPPDPEERKGPRDPLKAPLALQPAIPQLLSAVIVKALSLNPAERYAGAKAMLAALDPLYRAEDLRKELHSARRPDGAEAFAATRLLVTAGGLAPLERGELKRQGYQPLADLEPAPLPSDTALTILEHTTAALGMLHAAGSVHAHLSLDNIFTDSEGHAYLVVDVAHSEDAESDFSPPRQLAHTTAGDYWSLAAITFFLLTDRTLLKKAKTGPLQAPDDLERFNYGEQKIIPQLLRKALNRMLSASPNPIAVAPARLLDELQPLFKVRDIRKNISVYPPAASLILYATTRTEAQEDELKGYRPLSKALRLGKGLRAAQVCKLIDKLAPILDMLHAPPAEPHGRVSLNTVLVDADWNARLLMDEARLKDDLEPADMIFVAPELRRGPQATMRGDVYALAALACELITGKEPPFDVKDQDRLRAVLSDDITRATSRRTVSATLRVIARGMHYDPSERHSTCPEFAVALAAALKEDRIP